MAEKKNFLLGYGERLTRPIEIGKRGGDKNHPYSAHEAVARLTPQVLELASEINRLPQRACPSDEAVAAITLHPSYLAKSYFPTGLLETYSLRAVGSRSRVIKPDKWGIKEPPESAVTAQLFIAGKRSQFQRWAAGLSTIERTPVVEDFRKFETVDALHSEDRLRPMHSDAAVPALEVVLHASNDPRQGYILKGFRDLLEELGVDPEFKRQVFVEGLCFIGVRVPREKLIAMAEFSFLRVAREVPSLRPLVPMLAPTREIPSAPPVLPTNQAVASDIRAVVFDGGLPDSPDLSRWVTYVEELGLGTAKYQDHGLAVTSSLLFGSLHDGNLPSVPFCKVDHVRVLDENTGITDPFELFDVIDRIARVVERKEHQFINLSIGPNLPVEDDDVHIWTARLDNILSSGHALASIAVGNNGENDRASGNARIQTPADCVNALSIGAADSYASSWNRAVYSSLGPGRSPGVVKPDGLVFGGCLAMPFLVLTPGGNLGGMMGTSFAAPSGLRAAIGVRTVLGPIMSPLLLKALLVHRAEDGGHSKADVGWGRFSTEIQDLTTCDEGSAHILYQGELTPSRYLRAQVPIPKGKLRGMIEIEATFCYATPIDPQDPVNYTRAGLEATFRPNSDKRSDPRQQHADSKGFFSAGSLYASERQRRDDAHKWETTLKGGRRFRPDGLKDPVFDIFYNARSGGSVASKPANIPYALVITVRAPKMPELYDGIVQRYRNQLEILRPVIAIPVPAA